MDKVRINGGKALKGSVNISGAKNATLPLMAACLLTDETLRLSNLPHLIDISTMANLLVQHGVDFNLDGCSGESGHIGQVILLNASGVDNFEAPYEIVSKMRASVLVLGPLLAKHGRARVSLPGGCAIGTRPIDLHLSALEKMGTVIELEDGYISAHVKGRLKGADITFNKVSVGATENVLTAAVLAEGTTIMRNTAKEPEVTDLAKCLVKMGADISGIGTSTLVINGVEKLGGADYSVVCDRIEAGTYMIAAIITGGEILITGADWYIMESTIEKLIEIGAAVEKTNDGILVKMGNKKIKTTDVVTEPYPGFPTDMQAQFMALLTIVDGISVIDEKIFENRFMHVSELTRMGAKISVEGSQATISGVKELKGAEIMATDLRASVSLVLAGLAAKGETVINRMYHIDRGYERIEEKLAAVGANIERLK